MSEAVITEMKRRNQLLFSDPEQYLAMLNEEIKNNPQDPHLYFERHQGFDRTGQHEEALNDLQTSIALDPRPVCYECQGNVLMNLGRYSEALDSFNQAEAMDPSRWQGGYGSLYRADCHARMGNEEAAVSDAMRLPDDHWTPGLCGAPKGNKAEVITELRRRTAAAKR